MGIDPGTSPAVVVLGPGGKLLTYQRDLCFGFTDTLGRNRREPAIPELCAMLRQYAPDIVVIEQVASRPMQGVASTARFLYSTGLIVGAAMAMGCNVIRPTPQTWQKALQVRDGKDGARARCAELLPELGALLRVKAAHHLADAGLMALYGFRSLPTAVAAW